MKIELTEEDVLHRIETWKLSRWSHSGTDTGGIAFVCLELWFDARDLGRIWEAFKPEWMDVTRSLVDGKGMTVTAIINWTPHSGDT